MEEEENDFNKQQQMGDVKSVTSIGNSWIICRSQSHGGRIYYFNTLTGKAVWNLSDAEIDLADVAQWKAELISTFSHSQNVKSTIQTVSKWEQEPSCKLKKAHIQTMPINEPGTPDIQDCPEPLEPPVDLPHCTHPPSVPRIYNKQIINNQFSKQFIPPFVSPQCHCGSLNHMCEGLNVVHTPVYNPNMWTVPPPQPMFLNPALSLTNPPIFHNLHPQNVECNLPNRFHVMNTFAKSGPFCPQGVHKKSHHNFNSRTNQRFTRTFQNKSMVNDLRNVLSARRKVSTDTNSDSRQQLTANDQGTSQNVASIAEDDLYPSDIDDEWLQAFREDEEGKLNIDASSLRRLASGAELEDRWFIVASAIVLVNHMKFLTALANSDDKLHVIIPMEVRRALRSATGAAGRAARRAQRATKWAAQQTNKVPADLDSCKDGSIVSCCLDLVQRNYYVIHLTDDSDLQKNETEISKLNDCVPVFTVNEMKLYIVDNSAPAAPRENITVTLFPDAEDNQQMDHKEELDNTDFGPDDQDTPNNDNSAVDEVLADTKELEKEQNLSPKKTANASVQTDLYIVPTPQSSSVNSVTEVLEIDHTFNFDIVVDSDSSKDATSAKKMKLYRRKSIKIDDSVTKPTTFKWRKRRTPTSLLATEDTGANKPDFLQCLIQPNDNAVDYGKSEENPEAPKSKVEKPMFVDTSTSDVISNSVESNSMFKVNRGAIVSDPQRYEKDIVMFQVTGGQMDDYLSAGSDEWLSRFVQIMEEALTQVLQQEPYFDASIPPPWSIQEAVECVKQKFKHNNNIALASYTLNTFLEEITDKRGKINHNLVPKRFMQMYSYGVNLIEALQSELKDSEDIQIALESLSKLLFDIRNPNVDGSYVFPESFANENMSPSAATTDSIKYDGSNNFALSPEKPTEIATPAVNTPVKTPEKPVEIFSPRKYNLRSAEKKKTEEKKPSNETSFCTGLGLQKNIFVDGAAIKVSFNNSKTIAPASPSLENHVNEIEPVQVQPKIIRTFNKNQNYEEKIKNSSQYEEFTEDKNCSGNGFYLEDCDGFEDNEAEKKCSSMGSIDTEAVFNWFVERTFCPIHTMLKKMHAFCMDGSEDLKRKDTIGPARRMELFNESAKLKILLDNFYKHLNGMLERKDTQTKFRNMMQVMEVENFELSEAQATMYESIIGKYLKQAGALSQCLELIANEVTPSLMS